MLGGFMHDVQPTNYVAMVVSKRNILDTLEDSAAERLLLPNPQKKGKTDYVHVRGREHQEEESQEVRPRASAASEAGPRPPRSRNTRSMTTGSTSTSPRTKRKAEETPAPEFDEQHLTNRYMEGLFEEVPYIDTRWVSTRTTTTTMTTTYAEIPQQQCTTASFHNFKSQIFKFSVSNPKIKYVAYVSVLSKF